MWDILGAIAASASSVGGLLKGTLVQNTGVSSSAAVTVPFPTGTVVGDLVLVFMSTSAVMNRIAGDGWNFSGFAESTSGSTTSGISRVGLWWKKLDGTGDTITIDKNASRYHILQVMTFTGVDHVVSAHRSQSSSTSLRGLQLDWAEFTGDRVWLRNASSIWSSTTNRVVNDWPPGYSNYSEQLAPSLGPQQALCWIEGDDPSPEATLGTFLGGSSDLYGLNVGVGNRSFPTGPYVHSTRTRRQNSSSLRIWLPPEAEVGDLLVVCTMAEQSQTLAEATGWTTLAKPTFITPLHSTVHWKILDGTDDSPLTQTSSNTVQRIFSILVKNATLVENTSASASTSSLVAPALTPSGMTGEKLWINFSSVRAIRNINNTVWPASPWIHTGHTDTQLGIATLRNSDASVTPSNFEITSSGSWNAYTIAVGNA